MKNLFLTLIAVIALATTTRSQVVNQITISPSNPTANDTISVISNLSYYGNCSYGLIYSDAYLAGSIINITPTYCGYLDTTLCNSIDTFKIGPYPAGNYTINIDYHQGSVCPISGFDATIAHFDTLLTISSISAISNPQHINLTSLITTYPNPAMGQLTVEVGNFATITEYQLKITNSTGQKVFQSSIDQRQLFVDLSSYSKGIYFVYVTDEQSNLIDKRKIVIQ